MKIVAIDMGKSKSVARMYEGKEMKQRLETIRTDASSFHDLLVREEPELVLIEIGPAAGWVCDLCQMLGIAIKVANTSDEPWRWRKLKSKSDEQDTAKLLKLELLGELKTVHVPVPRVRQWRQLISYRQAVVSKVTEAKNRIRGILEGQGIHLAAGDRAWSPGGCQEIEKIGQILAETDPEHLWRGMVKLELEDLLHLRGQLEQVEAKLEEIARADERVERLQSAPGVGRRIAEMVVSMIDRPERFGRAGQVGAWAGLTPRRFQSGQMELEGHISHAGSAQLRQLLIQGCWSGLRKEGWIQSTFTRISGGNRKRRRLAIVAVARRLLVRLWAMLRDGTSWSEEGSRVEIAA
jgi:transposase